MNGRIAVLDVLRGVAILGTLGTNIWIFTDPAGPAGFLDLPTSDSVAGAVETVARALANGKFLALLTVLFGVGLEIQHRSALRRGVRWPGRYLWRCAVLFCEGLLHYLLIFEFDVLMAYAVVAVIVARLVACRDRVLHRVTVAVAVLHLAVVGLVTAALVLGPQGGAGPLSSRPDLYARGTWFEQVSDRIALAGIYRAEAVFIVPLGIVLFVVGIRLLRAGAFAGDAAGARLRRRLIGYGLGLGVPLTVAAVVAGPNWFVADRYVCAPLVAVGLLGAIVSGLHAVRGGALRAALAAVGRTALSCYVGQNLLASVLCYGWGLGLAARFADVRPWWVFGLWAAICAVFLLAAPWWLRRFERGPVEWLTHRAYGLVSPAPVR